MLKVAIYVRSSKDLHNVSCEAQEKQIKKVVEENKEAVYRVFRDQALSSTRDVRPEFDEMISLAMSKNSPFNKIYCLDTSRFGRDQHETQVLLYELRRKHGIDVIFVNMPNTGTYLDPAFEAIMSAFDYIHSQQSKAKGLASMKQNVINGYRAGGRAPYGYRLIKFDQGKHRSGNTIYKSKLEPDPETANFAREYFERRSRFEERRSILEDFYRRGIPSPTGRKKWPLSSAKSLEDNLEQYLGNTLFNRHNERVKKRGHFDGYLGGVKWRAEEEWIKCDNTHEPLITPEVADKIREIKQRGLREHSNTKRIYSLSGILKCGTCGTNYSGNRGIYVCNSKSKIGEKCDNNDISQRIAENAVFSFLDDRILNFKNVKKFIDQLKRKMDRGSAKIKPLEKRLVQIESERRKIKDLYIKGLIDENEIEDEMGALNDQKQAISEDLENAKIALGAYEISDTVIKEVINNFSKEIENADPKIKKRAVQALLQEIRIFPKEGSPWERLLEIKGACLPLTPVKVASPTGFEPVLPA